MAQQTPLTPSGLPLQEDGGAAEEGRMTQDLSASVTRLLQRIVEMSTQMAAGVGDGVDGGDGTTTTTTTTGGPFGSVPGVPSPSSSVTLMGLFEELFSLEKKCRQTNDSSSGARLCCFYLQLLADACFLDLPSLPKGRPARTTTTTTSSRVTGGGSGGGGAAAGDDEKKEMEEKEEKKTASFLGESDLSYHRRSPPSPRGGGGGGIAAGETGKGGKEDEEEEEEEAEAKGEAAAAAAAERVAAQVAAEAKTAVATTTSSTTGTSSSSTNTSGGASTERPLRIESPEAIRVAATAATLAAAGGGAGGGGRGTSISTTMVVVITLTYLCDQLTAICKKRGQLKRTIIEAVKQAMQWLPRLPRKIQKIELIEALKKVTAGKIFVEVDRARLILLLAEVKEAEGKIDEAAQLLQEVQVETYGAMETREKTEYILKQMELVLRKGDYIRCQIISKKINKRLLASGEALQDLKIKFYRLMVTYYIHEDLTLDCCKAFYSIFETPSVQANKEEWKLSLQCYILFMLLAPFDDEVKQLAEAVKKDEAKKLKEMPVFLELLTDMTKGELLDWPLPYEDELKKHPVFQDKPIHTGGDARWKLLRRRALQHNIRVMGTYYSRVHMDRVAALLHISRDEVETEISELVCSNFLHAKMDRPAGTVEFGMKKSTFDRLNAWARDVSKVLEKVDLCSHLIQRERMVHAARARNAALMARHGS